MGLDNDDIKALIAILQKGLDDQENIEVAKPKTIKPKSKATIKKKKTSNKFEQMTEFSMCKEDTEFDKKIKKPPPSVRNRTFDFVKAKCRVCGKTEKVAPSLIESIDRYKCNKCSTGAG
jgi:hypothetical protein